MSAFMQISERTRVKLFNIGLLVLFHPPKYQMNFNGVFLRRVYNPWNEASLSETRTNTRNFLTWVSRRRRGFVGGTRPFLIERIYFKNEEIQSADDDPSAGKPVITSGGSHEEFRTVSQSKRIVKVVVNIPLANAAEHCNTQPRFMREGRGGGRNRSYSVWTHYSDWGLTERSEIITDIKKNSGQVE